MTVSAEFHIHPSPQSKVSILGVAALCGKCMGFPVDQGPLNRSLSNGPGKAVLV